jgi:predicted transcriptional regulator
MKLEEVCQILGCSVLEGGNHLEEEVSVGCGADLMSDVLAFIKPDSVLLTGLTNVQTVRTAEIAEVKAIVYVRGKVPEKEVVSLAAGKGITLLATESPMYEACGKLYRAGLSPGTGV